MANLIITVISIALVAVAALMGAYYGGTAFMDGQAKANANTLVAQGEQIAAAWALAATNEGGSYDTIGGNASTVTRLTTSTPVYLTAEPVPPNGAVDTSVGANNWTMIKLSTNAAATPYNGLRVVLRSTSAGLNVCNLLAVLAAGSAATPKTQNTLDTATTSVDVSPTTGRKFDCIQDGTAASDARVFVYRVTS